MKAADYRKMTVEELQKELDGLRKNLFQIRTKQVTDVLEKTHTIRETHQDMARLLTILNERRAKAAKAAPAPAPAAASSAKTEAKETPKKGKTPTEKPSKS